MTVIDLGEMLPETGSPIPVTPLIVSASWARRLRVIGLLTLLLITLFASASPAPPPLTALATIHVVAGTGLAIVGDRVLVVSGSGYQEELDAYRLDGGARIWTRRIAGDLGGVNFTVTGTTVLATSADPGTSDVLTRVIDLESGDVLWSVHAFAAPTVVVGGVITYTTFSGPVAIGGGATVLKSLDDRTGATRWTETIPESCQISFGSDAMDVVNGIVELCATTQRLLVRDIATGLVRVDRTIDLAPTLNGELLTRPSLDLFNGLVIVGHGSASRVGTAPVPGDGPLTTFDAYRASDLVPLWSDSGAADNQYYYPCDAEICRATGSDSTAAVIDPQTGAVINNVPLPMPSPSISQFSLVEGKPTTLVLVPTNETPQPVASDIFPTYVYAIREREFVGMPPRNGGITWVARQTPTGLRPIQQIPAVRADSCVVITSYLACEMPGFALDVWRLP